MVTAADLAGASDADVTNARAALSSFLQSKFPTLSLTSSQLADLVLGPSAVALAAVEAYGESVAASFDPAVALASGVYDVATLNSVLAGRGVTRNAASTASGFIGVKFSVDTTRTIPINWTVKTADGVQFKTTTTVTVLPSGSTPTSSVQVAAVVDPTGGYSVSVPASAVNSGANGNVLAGTALTAVSSTLDGTISSVWASSTFTGGADVESDAALLTRLPAATAPRTTGSAAGAVGILTNAVPSVSYATSVGFGDPVLVRGRSVLASQSPGRQDVWFRFATSPVRNAISVTATYVDTVGPNGVWRFTLPVGVAAGLYTVEKVVRSGTAITATGYTPTVVTFGFDLSQDVNPPDVRTVTDAALTSYTTAVVTFTDVDTPTAGLTLNTSTKAYTAVVRQIPYVSAAQTALSASSVSVAGGDCLARGALPASVSVTASYTPAVGVTLTSAQVQAAVAAAVNATGVSNTLSVPAVTADALSRLPAGTTLQLSNWSATLYPVDNSSNVTVSGTTALTFATDYARNISPKSVAFYLDPANVTIV